ncbi:uncharacterized protein LOC121765506 [Salvia splendens]|uniref:uncharacterized protein LOC121765506 n=1 Tax=Salvia splendens TaxID=180675 RepID=UPI001C2700EE|nr:uncharacterized protein LOC121765506 [Salvia splendens]
MEELKEIYGITTDEFNIPREFKNGRFWNDIIVETERFKAARAKSSMIRKLWYYMLRCCGGRHCAPLGREHKGMNTVMDIEALRRSHDLGVEYRGRAFFLQRLKDHFPLPDPVNTYINGPVDKRNWQMNSPIHQASTARYPNRRFDEVDPDEYEEFDRAEFPEAPEVPENLMIGHVGEDEDEDEEIPPCGDDGVGTSTHRTRSLQEREEEDYGSINERMTRMELR